MNPLEEVSSAYQARIDKHFGKVSSDAIAMQLAERRGAYNMILRIREEMMKGKDATAQADIAYGELSAQKELMENWAKNLNFTL